MDNKLKCPKCGSTDVHKQSGFAKQKSMGKEVSKPHLTPNVCLNENCNNEWFDEIKL